MCVYMPCICFVGEKTGLSHSLTCNSTCGSLVLYIHIALCVSYTEHRVNRHKIQNVMSYGVCRINE